MKTVCIMCPVGCELNITQKDDVVTVTGNACARGITYGTNEITNPMRVVTALLKTKIGVLPVKTNGLIPKNLMLEVVKEINKINIDKAKFGDVIIENVLNTSVNVVVTGNYSK